MKHVSRALQGMKFYHNFELRFRSTGLIRYRNIRRKKNPLFIEASRMLSSSTKINSTTHDSDDLNDDYYPGSHFSSTSKHVVVRAMAGNSIITVLKTLAWAKTGSTAMLSEAIHSLVDTGNQGLLLLGLQQAAGVPDKKHQYGYGRAAYFWSLISALGMFWLGAGVTVSHGIDTLFHPPTDLSISWEAWSVLGASFIIDGWVLSRVVRELRASKPPGVSLRQHIKGIKDPIIMAVFYEDSSACIGVVMALAGIAATQITGNVVWDSIASIGIGGLLGVVAISLIRLNQRFLLGQSVEPGTFYGIIVAIIIATFIIFQRLKMGSRSYSCHVHR